MIPGFLRSRSAVLTALVVVAVVLSACNDTPRIISCPGSAILADAATRPVLKPGTAATDPAALLYTVHAVTIDTNCVLDRRAGETNSNVDLTFRATRTPNGRAAHYVVPYFLAINQGERVINKRMFNVVIDFAPGASVVAVQTAVNNTVLRLENGHLPTDYQFLAGLQLSDAELAYLKSVGPYTP